MRRYLLPFFLGLYGCAHGPTAVTGPDGLREKMSMVGQGKARLEIGPESWVFSFDAAYPEANRWVMAMRIPLQGEEVFAFDGLDEAVPPPADEGDFRARVVHALRHASEQRKLGYPQAGHDFARALHGLLSLLRPAGRAAMSCRDVVENGWSCVNGGQVSRWFWDARKNEARVEFSLRGNWRMAAIFKNLTGPVFTRVTLEVIRNEAENDHVELRQEFFFQQRG